MPQSIAFLRAINVGGRVVTMERLRGLFEEAGFEGVQSYIASGNIIFEAGSRGQQKLERLIEHTLREALGYEVPTFVRTAQEVAQTAHYTPFPDEEADAGSLFVAFLRDTPGSAAIERLLACQTPIDSFHVHGREAYWLCRVRASETKVTLAHLERALGMDATVRNVSTVRKLAARYGA